MHKFMSSSVGFVIAAMALTWLPASAADAIVVGRSLTLSGPLKLYGEAKRDGGDAYIAKVNAAGGINGKKIEVVTLDDAYLPANIVANLKKLAALPALRNKAMNSFSCHNGIADPRRAIRVSRPRKNEVSIISNARPCSAHQSSACGRSISSLKP